MLLLAAFNFLLWIARVIGDLILPRLPAEVTNILAYIFSLIHNGMSFCFNVLFNHATVSAVAYWLVIAIPACFVYDMAWKIVYTITLRHHND